MRTTGEWLCRDGDGWRVRVPTPGGHRYFLFSEYGGAQKALKAARKFHEKMLRQLEADREFERKTGEKVKRKTLNARNRSGHEGISIQVFPRVTSKEPRVEYTATWTKNGRQYKKVFSSFAYPTKEDALKAAIEWRKKMYKHK